MLTTSISGFCEGFRMPAAHGRIGGLWRPASESLQGRKPREVARGLGSTRYRGVAVGR